MTRAIDRRRMGFFAGVGLVLVSLLGLSAPVLAQSDGAVPKQEPARVDREGYFTAQSDGAVPATLTNELPPGIVCILIPQVCGAQTQPVAGPLGQATEPAREADVPDYQAEQPVEPNTLPVGMLGGKPRYTSYVRFGLPAIPKGSLIDRFDLVMTQTDVSYALESPAFRQAVLAGLVTYQTRSPAAFTQFVGDVANDTAPLATNKPTGIELCAVTEAWKGEPSQDAATQPAKDCIFGANGVYNAADDTWTFDLSLLAQAWLDGTTANEGVYLGPIGSDNLAFGDADTSTNWQVSLAGAQNDKPPQIRYAFSEGFGDDAALDDFGGELTLDDADLGGEVVGSFDTFGGALDPTVDSSTFAGARATRTPTTAVAPAETAAGPTVRARLAGESRPKTPWWLWLLLPLGLGLAYAFSRSLEETPPAGRASSGALTRLMGDVDVRPTT